MSNLADLNQLQRERLSKLASEMTYDRLCVSFSIEGRGEDNTKRSAFYSATVSRGGTEGGWNRADHRLVRLVLCKQVVQAVYEDSIRRGILDSDTARKELNTILGGYDASIVNALGEGQ